VVPDSDLGVALWVAGGGRDIEQGDVVSGDGEMGFRVAERAANMAWNDLLPPVRRGQVSTVLVELPGGEGVVRRGDVVVVVTQDVHTDRGLPLRADDIYRPVKTWLPDDRSLVGGFCRRAQCAPRSWMTVGSGSQPGSVAVRTLRCLSSPTTVTSRSCAAVTRPDLRSGASAPGRISGHAG
jgi:hypothetical protein